MGDVDPSKCITMLAGKCAAAETSQDDAIAADISDFPSGNGAAGGNFNFRLNYLTGDTTGDRAVLARDFADVKKKFFQDTTSPVTGTDTDYSPFYDLDGSGFILAIDFAEVKKRCSTNPRPRAHRRARRAGIRGRFAVVGPIEALTPVALAARADGRDPCMSRSTV